MLTIALLCLACILLLGFAGFTGVSLLTLLTPLLWVVVPLACLGIAVAVGMWIWEQIKPFFSNVQWPKLPTHFSLSSLFPVAEQKVSSAPDEIPSSVSAPYPSAIKPDEPPSPHPVKPSDGLEIGGTVYFKWHSHPPTETSAQPAHPIHHDSLNLTDTTQDWVYLNQ